MAIDTRDKRASCINAFLPFGRCGPTPDGSFASSADRVHLAYGYRGIVPTPITFDDTIGADSTWSVSSYGGRTWSVTWYGGRSWSI